MAYRVIQWGLGKNGAALARAIHRHADLELVGCRVWSADKHGKDVGMLADIERIGLAATMDAGALLAIDADVVIHCPRLTPDMAENDREICDLLRSGKNVISVSGAHSMPTAIPGYAAQFEVACREGNSSFTAAGVNPGFIGERLATMLTGLCADVDAVRIRETYDCSNGTADILFETMGFGLPLGDWSAESPVAEMFNHLFVQVIGNMAATLDVELAEVRRTTNVAPADRAIMVAGRLIAPGTVAAIAQTWEGIPVDPDQIRITKETRWVIANDIPGWKPHSGWRVDVTGKPSLQLDLRLDPADEGAFEPEAMVGAAIPVIPELISAPPGLLTPFIYAPFRKRFRT